MIDPRALSIATDLTLRERLYLADVEAGRAIPDDIAAGFAERSLIDEGGVRPTITPLGIRVIAAADAIESDGAPDLFAEAGL